MEHLHSSSLCELNPLSTHLGWSILLVSWTRLSASHWENVQFTSRSWSTMAMPRRSIPRWGTCRLWCTCMWKPGTGKRSDTFSNTAGTKAQGIMTCVYIYSLSWSHINIMWTTQDCAKLTAVELRNMSHKPQSERLKCRGFFSFLRDF